MCNYIYISNPIKTKSNIIDAEGTFSDISNNLFINKPSFIQNNNKLSNDSYIYDNDDIIFNLKNKFNKLKIQKYKLVYDSYDYYYNIKIIESIII